MKRTIVLIALALAMAALAATVGVAKAHAAGGNAFCVNGVDATSDEFTDGAYQTAADNSPVFTDVGTPAQSTETGETFIDAIEEGEWSTSSVEGLTVMTVVTRGPCAPPEPRPTHGLDRAGYCLNGVFENLGLGQPKTDPAFKGAVPAFYIDGKGLTCDAPSGAFTQAAGDVVASDGSSTGPTAPGDIYPHYKKTG